jgi:L-cysteine/cystine lyase
MDVSKLREQIPTTSRMNYMNTGWAGPSPVSVSDAIKRRIEYESDNGPASIDVVESGKAIDLRAKEAVAGLINASPDEVLLTANTTEGLNVVMTGLPWRQGDEIITCNLEHPSVLVPAYHLQPRRGVRVRVLHLRPDETHESILTQVEAALSERTRMVLFSHVQYSSGLRMPVEEIRALTRPRGVWMLLDGAQGAGHVPVDVRVIDCDFYSLPGQKWLLGPDATGALYIRESLIPVVEPIRTGSKSVKEFDYSGGYVPDARTTDKFKVGSANAALRAGFVEGMSFVQQVGIAAIAERSRTLAAVLKSALSDVPGITVLSPLEGPGCSGLVSFTVEGAEPKESCAWFWDSHRIVVRDVEHPPCLRASLDFFNTEDEVAGLVDAARELALASGG